MWRGEENTVDREVMNEDPRYSDDGSLVDTVWSKVVGESEWVAVSTEVESDVGMCFESVVRS